MRGGERRRDGTLKVGRWVTWTTPLTFQVVASVSSCHCSSVHVSSVYHDNEIYMRVLLPLLTRSPHSLYNVTRHLQRDTSRRNKWLPWLRVRPTSSLQKGWPTQTHLIITDGNAVVNQVANHDKVLCSLLLQALHLNLSSLVL